MSQKHTTITSMEEYRKRYFPRPSKDELMDRLSPRDFGIRLANDALKKLGEALAKR